MDNTCNPKLCWSYGHVCRYNDTSIYSQGIFGSMFSAGAVIGVAIGGTIVNNFGWHLNSGVLHHSTNITSNMRTSIGNHR